MVALCVPSSAEGLAVYAPENRLPLQLLWVCQGWLHCIALQTPAACCVVPDKSGSSHTSDDKRHHCTVCITCIV